MKSYLIFIYNKVKASKQRFINFVFPNLFTKTNYSYVTVPSCQQRTEITGLGKVTIGEKCGFGYRIGGFWRNGCVELQARYRNAEIIIGNKVYTNNNIFICAANLITVGNNTRIGQNVCIMDFEAHGTNPLERSKIGIIGTVEIGENVWIGNNVTILKNTKIGKNSIVATGAVVNGIFPDNVIIGGIPAKIIKLL